MQISQQQELTGSPIPSDKPIALWGAASCLNVPVGAAACDSAHPFYFAQYMTGCLHVLSTSSEGDPEWVNVVPPQQYLKRYVFFTDPSYAETSLVVVRQRDAGTNAFVDVELDCAGTLTGWQVVGDYEYTRIDLVTGNFQNVGSCSNGRHQMSSAAPFGVTVWGWGTNGTTPATGAVSYAYPAGAGIKSINDIVVPATPK